MDNKLVFIYDNRNEINSSISKIVGLNSYGDIIYRRKRLRNIVQNTLQDLGIETEFIQITTDRDTRKLVNTLEHDTQNKIYVNYFSS